MGYGRLNITNEKMKFECYLCGKKIVTNDLFGSMGFYIEGGGDIIDTIQEEKLCSWCVHRFGYWREIIKEYLKKEKKKETKK